jgi:hypothetical protein
MGSFNKGTRSLERVAKEVLQRDIFLTDFNLESFTKT